MEGAVIPMPLLLSFLRPFFCHSRAGGNLENIKEWTPAYARVTREREICHCEEASANAAIHYRSRIGAGGMDRHANARDDEKDWAPAYARVTGK